MALMALGLQAGGSWGLAGSGTRVQSRCPVVVLLSDCRGLGRGAVPSVGSAMGCGRYAEGSCCVQRAAYTGCAGASAPHVAAAARCLRCCPACGGGPCTQWVRSYMLYLEAGCCRPPLHE
jgi:hypothetical protein